MKKEPFLTTPGIEYRRNKWWFRPKKSQIHLYDNKTFIKLGDSIHDVYEFLARSTSSQGAVSGVDIRTLGQALTIYLNTVVPLKGVKSREANTASIKRIRQVFGESGIESISVPDIIQYRDAVQQKIEATTSYTGHKTANSDIEVFSNLYTQLVLWGVIAPHKNPFTGTRQLKFPLAPRDRYVEHWEIQESLKVANPFLQLYIRIKLKTGFDKKTLLQIKLSDLQETGFIYQRSKAKRWNSPRQPKKYFAEYDDELIQLINDVIESKPVESEFLFSTREGKSYYPQGERPDAFDSMWQRFMRKVLNETNVTERFTEHDLRAKNASDETDAAIAQSRLSHSSRAMTDSYRRKPQVVQPLALDQLGFGVQK